jgi:phage protein D
MAASELIDVVPGRGTYAPDYAIEVEGRELDPTTKGDVRDLRVVLDIDNIASVDLTINNWDDRRLAFKYSDTDTFEVGRRLHVSMGYAGALVPMIRGQVATMTPRFPEAGSPTLTVSGLDGLFLLRDRKPGDGEATKYVGRTDWEIARIVARRNGLAVEVTEEGPVHDEVVQKNQDDAHFLMERAKRIDFDCHIVTDLAGGPDKLHFVKPTDGRDGRSVRVYRFRWGRSLISFSPSIDMSHQVSSVTVRGWDPSTKEAIVATASSTDLPGAAGAGTSGPAAVERSTGGKKDVVVDAPVTGREEAERLSRALLTERAYEFITGTGEAVGLPELRPGQNVELLGLGQRFSGSYYVKRVEHTLGPQGFRTRFHVRRVYDGGPA